jgi:hypothetical protein
VPQGSRGGAVGFELVGYEVLDLRSGHPLGRRCRLAAEEVGELADGFAVRFNRELGSVLSPDVPDE